MPVLSYEVTQVSTGNTNRTLASNDMTVIMIAEHIYA